MTHVPRAVVDGGCIPMDRRAWSMKPLDASPLRWLAWVVACLTITSPTAVAADRPVTGRHEPGFEPLDEAVLAFMDLIGCRAATVAVSRDGRLLLSRGYGWSGSDDSTPVAPDALLRIASVTKPITAAAVKNAVRAGRLSLDTKAFDLVSVGVPSDRVADPRVRRVTVGHLLDHQGGWDRDVSFDPMARTPWIQQESRSSIPPGPKEVIAFMLARPLDFSPGDKTAYSNFGYCVLGRVLESVYERPYFECIRQTVCEPLGIDDIRLGRADPAHRGPREVSYPAAGEAVPLDVMDAHGGLVASAPALCRFLDAYWLSGEPRPRGDLANWTIMGSLPGTTALVRQRPDGINVAVLFNGRRDRHFREDNGRLQETLDEAVGRCRTDQIPARNQASAPDQPSPP